MSRVPLPIPASLVAAQAARLSGVSVDGAAICWLETRPAEGGRVVLMRREGDGRLQALTPPGFSVRTRVHEYGGGGYVATGASICFCNDPDQRVYRMGEGTAGEPVPVTPAGGWRYADATFDPRRRRIICVREDHSAAGREPATTLVGVAIEGGETAGVVLASGHDFYSTPRVSPDGTQLAWLAWRHPQMPWDGTELWVADIDASGALAHLERVAGGPDESIYQPGWSPDGTLYFVSDRDGWWQVYRRRDGAVGAVVRNAPPASEFGRPQWVFGTATWAFADASRLVVSYTTGGRWRLATVDVDSGVLRDVPTPFEPAPWLAAMPDHAVLVAGTPYAGDALVRIHLDTGRAETLRTISAVVTPGIPGSAPDPGQGPGPTLDEGHEGHEDGGHEGHEAHEGRDAISVAQAVAFRSRDGETVHAFYYAPSLGGSRRSFAGGSAPDRGGGPGPTLPPLIVIGHGGPTSAARATLDLGVQFWTSHGFAVVDVNYRGSTGYGRAYRQRLNGQWGVMDVADMIDAAESLVRAGKADPARLVIRGGSAGGYTALAALAFHPGVFAAAASYYGVSDLEALARDTHKFESRYLDRLVGPYPAARDEYRRRSPVHAAGAIACPIILFQGLEDRVVPPDQSERIAEAVRGNGWPVTYMTFEGESHGFRRADTITRCLEAELGFYEEILSGGRRKEEGGV